MLTLEELDKIVINVRSHKILKQILKEIPKEQNDAELRILFTIREGINAELVKNFTIKIEPTYKGVEHSDYIEPPDY